MESFQKFVEYAVSIINEAISRKDEVYWLLLCYCRWVTPEQLLLIWKNHYESITVVLKQNAEQTHVVEQSPKQKALRQQLQSTLESRKESASSFFLTWLHYFASIDFPKQQQRAEILNIIDNVSLSNRNEAKLLVLKIQQPKAPSLQNLRSASATQIRNLSLSRSFDGPSSPSPPSSPQKTRGGLNIVSVDKNTAFSYNQTSDGKEEQHSHGNNKSLHHSKSQIRLGFAAVTRRLTIGTSPMSDEKLEENYTELLNIPSILIANAITQRDYDLFCVTSPLEFMIRIGWVPTPQFKKANVVTPSMLPTHNSPYRSLQHSPSPFRMVSEAKRNSQQFQAFVSVLHQQQELDHIDKLTQRFNWLSRWVITSILQVEDQVDKQVAVIEKFIDIGQKCNQLNNFHSLLAIISGLSNHMIQRLKTAWGMISPRFLEEFHSLEQLMSPAHGFEKYQQELSSRSLPIMPYIGYYLRSFSFMAENSLYLENGSVNKDLFGLMGKKIQSIQRMQATPYHLDIKNQVLSYLKGIKIIKNEDILFKMSLKCESDADKSVSNCDNEKEKPRLFPTKAVSMESYGGM